MDTIRFGMVGAGFIADVFAETLDGLPGVELRAIASARQSSARKFADRHHIPVTHADYRQLAADPTLDAVYVASPNSLHREHAIAMLDAGKHVLVEKPMAINAEQAETMIQAARRADRLLMEAYIAPFEPNIAAIREATAMIPQVRRVVLIKDQYSSRFDAYKAGANPAAFDPSLGGGSLLDLGFYPVSLAVHLFGEPLSVTATGVLLGNGADGQGTIQLGYDAFEVTCLHSKIATKGIDCQIAGELEVIVFDDPTTPGRVQLLSRRGPTNTARSSRAPEVAQDITREGPHPHMEHELQAFLELLRTEARESAVHPLANTVTAMRILDEARRQIGVSFPADN